MIKQVKKFGKRAFNKIKSSAKWAIKHPLRAAYRGALAYQTFRGVRGLFNVGKAAYQAHKALRARNAYYARRNSIYL